MKVRFSILIFVMVLSGCATTSLKPSDAHKISKSEGILVASVTRGIMQRGMMTNNGVTAYITINPKGQSVNGKVLGSNAKGSFGIGSGIAVKDGKLNVENMKPGEYQISTWELYVPGGGGAYISLSPKQFDPIDFVIEQGKVNYIGNIHLESVYGENFVGVLVEQGAEMRCDNKSQTDISLFQKEFPGFGSWEIRNAPIKC